MRTKTIKDTIIKFSIAIILIVFLWPMIIIEIVETLRGKVQLRKYRGHLASLESYAMCGIIMFFIYCGIGLWWWFTKIVAHL